MSLETKKRKLRLLGHMLLVSAMLVLPSQRAEADSLSKDDFFGSTFKYPCEFQPNKLTMEACADESTYLNNKDSAFCKTLYYKTCAPLINAAKGELSNKRGALSPNATILNDAANQFQNPSVSRPSQELFPSLLRDDDQASKSAVLQISVSPPSLSSLDYVATANTYAKSQEPVQTAYANLDIIRRYPGVTFNGKSVYQTYLTKVVAENRRKKWSENGSKLESCEEYVYEKYYDYSLFIDTLYKNGSDYYKTAKFAFGKDGNVRGNIGSPQTYVKSLDPNLYEKSYDRLLAWELTKHNLVNLGTLSGVAWPQNGARAKNLFAEVFSYLGSNLRTITFLNSASTGETVQKFVNKGESVEASRVLSSSLSADFTQLQPLPDNYLPSKHYSEGITLTERMLRNLLTANDYTKLREYYRKENYGWKDNREFGELGRDVWLWAWHNEMVNKFATAGYTDDDIRHVRLLQERLVYLLYRRAQYELWGVRKIFNVDLENGVGHEPPVRYSYNVLSKLHNLNKNDTWVKRTIELARQSVDPDVVADNVDDLNMQLKEIDEEISSLFMEAYGLGCLGPVGGAKDSVVCDWSPDLFVEPIRDSLFDERVIVDMERNYRSCLEKEAYIDKASTNLQARENLNYWREWECPFKNLDECHCKDVYSIPYANIKVCDITLNSTGGVLSSIFYIGSRNNPQILKQTSNAYGGSYDKGVSLTTETSFSPSADRIYLIPPKDYLKNSRTFEGFNLDQNLFISKVLEIFNESGLLDGDRRLVRSELVSEEIGNREIGARWGYHYGWSYLGTESLDNNRIDEAGYVSQNTFPAARAHAWLNATLFPNRGGFDRDVLKMDIRANDMNDVSNPLASPSTVTGNSKKARLYMSVYGDKQYVGVDKNLVAGQQPGATETTWPIYEFQVYVPVLGIPVKLSGGLTATLGVKDYYYRQAANQFAFNVTPRATLNVYGTASVDALILEIGAGCRVDLLEFGTPMQTTLGIRKQSGGQKLELYVDSTLDADLRTLGGEVYVFGEINYFFGSKKARATLFDWPGYRLAGAELYDDELEVNLGILNLVQSYGK